MTKLSFEFTDDTLVMTSQGVERLADILHRPVHTALWAIKWPTGISFHNSHKDLGPFIAQQMELKPEGPARLIDVSKYIAEAVQENGFCCTQLNSFEEAATYKD